jgi:catechol 2,3-dioxygenase-like lactoylglutathione lyase family enzyme
MPRVPIDHVTIRVADLERSLRSYDRVFGLIGFEGERLDGGGGHEWDDFSIVQADPDRRPTYGRTSGSRRRHARSSTRGGAG